MLIIINTVQDNIDNVLEVMAEDNEGFLPFSQSSNFTGITTLRNGVFLPLFFSSETNCVHQ